MFNGRAEEITTVVDLSSNTRLSIIEQIISLFAMHQGPTETNYEYLGRFNYWLQNLVIAGWKHIMYSLETMDKVVDTVQHKR